VRETFIPSLSGSEKFGALFPTSNINYPLLAETPNKLEIVPLK
jgi:hypothetical protein